MRRRQHESGTRRRGHRLLLLLVPPSIALTACLEPVIVGAEGGGGGATTATTAEELPFTNAGPTSGSATTSGGFFTQWNRDLPEPCVGCGDDMLWLIFDSDGGSCESPDDVIQARHDAFRVGIGFPPSQLTVGVHVPDDEVVLHALSETLVGHTGNQDPDDCTVDLEVVEDEVIVATIQGCSEMVPSNGTYTIGRCDPLELPPEATAVRQGAGDDAMVVLTVGSPVAACGDEPLADCAGDTFQHIIELPADVAGGSRYALADLTVTTCPAGGGPLTGTLDVLLVDEDSMVVRFADVGDHAELLEQDVRVARCL